MLRRAALWVGQPTTSPVKRRSVLRLVTPI